MRNTVAKKLKKFSFGNPQIYTLLKRNWHTYPRPVRCDYMQYLQEDYEYIKYHKAQKEKLSKSKYKAPEDLANVFAHVSPKRTVWQKLGRWFHSWFRYFFPSISQSKK